MEPQRPADILIESGELRAVINCLPHGLLTADDAGEIRFANSTAARLFGYTVAELVGSELLRLFPVWPSWSPLLDQPDRDVLGLRRGGETIALRLTVTSVVWDGHHLYAGTIDRSLNHPGAVLNRHAAHADRPPHDETRMAFLRRVSHELRTPLTSILGYAELLELDAQDRELRDGLEIIRKNGEQMLASLTTLMDDFAYWLKQEPQTARSE